MSSAGHCTHAGASRTYNAWRSMHARCESPKHEQFPNYGGRGIRVCPRWGEFVEFLADMGEAPPRMTLDREDTNGDYSPANCRWATAQEQQNNRRNNRRLTARGETLTVTEWAQRSGNTMPAILARIRYGWPVELAIFEPNRHGSRPVELRGTPRALKEQP